MTKNYSATLIIPTYNRAHLIVKALDSILASKISSDNNFEIIVVDNNSSDITESIVAPYCGQHGHITVRYTKEPRQGVAYARNCGAYESSSEILAYMDDEQVIDPFYLDNLVRAFEETQAVCVGGKIAYLNTENVPEWMEPLIETVGQLDLGNEVLYLNDTPLLLKCGNFAIKRKEMLSLGGFDVRYGRKGNELTAAEEDMLQEKLKSSGMLIAYCPYLLQYNVLLPAKFSKKYWRKHALGYGKTCFVISSSNSNNIKKIFGIPRFLIRSFATSVIRYFRAIPSCNEAKLFKKELKIFEVLGAIQQSLTSSI